MNLSTTKIFKSEMSMIKLFSAKLFKIKNMINIEYYTDAIIDII